MITSRNDSWVAAARRDSVSGITLAIALLATGCASTSGPLQAPAPQGEAAPLVPSTVYYTVRRGDQLAKIAETMTGSRGNWRAIAEHNGISSPKYLAVGALLEIPGDLLVTHDVAIAAEPAIDIDSVATAQSASRGEPTSRVRQLPVAAPAKVVLTPVVTNRHFDLSPMDAGVSGGKSRKRLVKVVGSYYPKGVYTAPDAASRVLMRLAPGTVLELEREYNGWFKVITGEGAGYLRAGDADAVSNNARLANADQQNS